MLTILHSGRPDAADLNAVKIARFMGAEIAAVPVSEASLTSGRTLILRAETLAELCDREGDSAEILRRASSHASNVFVYAFEPTKRHSRLLERLTHGAIVGVEKLRRTDSRFNVEADTGDTCGQFSGLSFGRANIEADFGFVCGRSGSVRSLVRGGEQPVLVSLQEGGCRWMLSGCREIADLDAMVTPRASILNFFSSVAPLMMFLRAALGDKIWRNEAPAACLIIDDPLLQRRYGFLDYYKLLQATDGRRFSATLAFIPWNFRRSDRKVANLFAAHPGRLSICIHGCDHTGGEFGSSDYQLLCEKSQLAMNRMDQHRRLTGLDFDPVMVFPQGIFSTAAATALKATGYLAAVNSTPYPIDAVESLTLRDLMEVANTRFSSFPIFNRRYPDAVEELAFDLFLGKPALLVVHHDFFRGGYDALAAAVDRVNALDARLRWTNLAAICSTAQKKRVSDAGSVEIQSPVRNQSGKMEAVQDRFSERPIYKAKVFVRRRLCELRDNYLDLNPFLSRSVRKARDLVLGKGAQD